jgi:hypothetical protein
MHATFAVTEQKKVYTGASRQAMRQDAYPGSPRLTAQQMPSRCQPFRQFSPHRALLFREQLKACSHAPAFSGGIEKTGGGCANRLERTWGLDANKPRDSYSKASLGSSPGL